jgi:hypothetical protein
MSRLAATRTSTGRDAFRASTTAAIRGVDLVALARRRAARRSVVVVHGRAGSDPGTEHRGSALLLRVLGDERAIGLGAGALSAQNNQEARRLGIASM